MRRLVPLFAAALLACEEKDIIAPPAPNVDPVTSPTTLSKQTITGSAEYGSTVRIKGGKADVEVRADFFTARFRAEVELATNASNGLELRAVDSAGNVSEPTTVSIVHEPVKPTGMELSLDPAEVSADDGTVMATARISHPEKGADLSGVSITFSVEGLTGGPAPQSAKTDSTGAAQVSLQGLKAAGAGAVKATADVNGLARSAALRVLPGKVSQVKLKLFKNAETTELADPVTISVGDRLRTESEPLDASGNTVGVPILISTNIPGALLEGKVLTNLERSGQYKVVATAANTTVFSSRSVTVGPGLPVKVTVSFTRASARAGEQVGVLASALDTFGNEVTDATITLAVAPTLAASFTIPGSSPAVIKDQGILPSTRNFVAYDLSGVSGSGYQFTITATVAGVTPALSAGAPLEVRPAPAFGFGCRSWTGSSCTDQQLEFLPATTPPSTTKSVQAGQDVDYRYAVVDLYGNPTTGPVSVFTDAPGAVVVDDGISGAGKISRLTVNGSFTVSFYIAGVGKKGALQLNVGTGPVGSVGLSASATLIGPNTDVKVFALVRDAFGNVIACTTATAADVAFTATSSTGGTVAQKGATVCFNSAFQATYNFTAEDTYAIESEYRPGGTATGVRATVYVAVLKFDTTPPAVSIPTGQLLRNGTPCAFSGTPPACVVQPGDFIEFVVSANDNYSLSELAYTAFFATAGATGTLRTRTVFVPSNSTLPLNQPFSFSVPGSFLEDVALTALAVDGAGNRATSATVILRVTFNAYKNRTASLVMRDLGGGIINAPEDVVVAPNGDLYVANRGNRDVLVLPSGSTFPSVYTSRAQLDAQSVGFAPGFILLDASGNLYVTDSGGSTEVLRISPGTPPTVVRYVDYTTGGPNLRGLAQTPSTHAKGLVSLLAPIDGDRVTVGANVYEVNSAGTCPNTGICLNVAASTPANVMTALAACVNSGTGCTVGSPGGTPASPHPTVQATASPSPTSVVILAVKTSGAAGNSTALTSSSCVRIAINAGCGTSFIEGHDATFFVGQEGGGAPQSAVYRFSFSLAGPYPRSQAAHEGQYDLFQGGEHEQWGLSVKDLSTAITRNARDLVFYFPDVTVGRDRLRGARYADLGPPVAVFNSAPVAGGRPGCADCIRGSNDTSPGVPLRTFSVLWDVILEPRPTTSPFVAPNGCLLASDAANGSIYTIDTRDPTTPDPLVSVVATGLGSPRGLDFEPISGDLFVAVSGADAVIKLGPSPDATDCF
ncbi:MAG: hypothetical protein HYZ28_23855 [Myxococcales bacterium]|nr:hypothetical protein [Myxococcales bacterium]